MSPARIRVITISRQYGSGGAAVAARVAAQLGWKLLDRALLQQATRAALCAPGVAERFDERVDPFLHRLSRSLWHGGFEAVAEVSDDDVLDADRMAALTLRAIQEAAGIGGCVIVGRGAACALAERDDALHAFVYASRAARAERLTHRLATGTDIQAAMDATDLERASYVKRHFGRDWIDLELYHLLVNTGASEEAAAKLILTAAGALDPQA